MYKLLSQSDIEKDDFLGKILENRGVTDREKFEEPSKDDVIHYSNLKNMKEALDLFGSVVEQVEPNVGIVVDPDIDGNTSSASLGGYIEEHFPHVNVVYFFQEGKEHGLTKYVVNNFKASHDKKPFDLLLIPDAGTSDYKMQCKIVEEFEVPILILDHHEAEKGESEFAIVVNNQISPKYENKQLSGVGIVYKFLQALDDKYGNLGADDYLDLLAWGNIADAMDLSSPETRYYVYEGLKNIKNKFFLAMIDKHIGDMSRVYPQSLSFALNPKINAVLRIGKEEEKIDLFNAFKNINEDSVNSRTGKTETLPQKMVRVSANAHKRQKTLREKWTKKIIEQINEKNLNQNAFLLIKIEEKFDRELGGVIASTLAQSYRKPTIILIWNEEKKAYTGSLRGYDPLMMNTKDFLEELELFDFLGGHQNACGFKIQKQQLFSLNDAINDKLGDNDASNLIGIDFYLTSEQVNVDTVDKVYEYEYLWGKGVDRPSYATTITVDTSKIKKSKSSNMIEWYHNDVKFVQFNGDVRLLDMIEDSHIVELTLIGSMSVNHFLGKATPQFLIDEVSIGELKTQVKEVEEVGKGDFLDDLFDW